VRLAFWVEEIVADISVRGSIVSKKAFISGPCSF
jgi:hypothetical protein